MMRKHQKLLARFNLNKKNVMTSKIVCIYGKTKDFKIVDAHILQEESKKKNKRAAAAATNAMTMTTTTVAERKKSNKSFLD